MKLLWLADTPISPARNGANVWAHNILPLMARHADHLTVCAPIARGRVPDAITNSFDNINTCFVEIDGDVFDPLSVDVLNRSLRRMLTETRQHEDASLIYDSTGYLYSGHFLEWLTGASPAKLVQHCMLNFSASSNGLPRRSRQWLANSQFRGFRAASKILCLSESERTVMEAMDASLVPKCAISPLGTEMALASIETRQSRRTDEPFRIGFIGRARDPTKGFDVFCAAIEAARRCIPQLSVSTAGDDKAAHVPGGLVEFCGWLDRVDLANLLDRLDCLVMPSRYEALGLAAVEAMARGVVVVASARGGLGEIIRDGENGVALGDDEEAWPLEIAEALYHLAAHPETRFRLAAAGLQSVRQYWTIERSFEVLRAHLTAPR